MGLRLLHLRELSLIPKMCHVQGAQTDAIHSGFYTLTIQFRLWQWNLFDRLLRLLQCRPSFSFPGRRVDPTSLILVVESAESGSTRQFPEFGGFGPLSAATAAAASTSSAAATSR